MQTDNYDNDDIFWDTLDDDDSEQCPVCCGDGYLEENCDDCDYCEGTGFI